MKMRKLFSLLALMAFSIFTIAQTRSISGKIKSSETGEGLPGATVSVKGTTNGSITDVDGNFKIEVGSDDPILLFTFIGFESKELAVGNQSTINISLESDSRVLDEFVVTALGISREKKSLGYSSQTVSAMELNGVKDVNFMSNLSGQVAGAQIKNSGTMGGSANVIIRGYKSIGGNNQPLYVVDGIPIRNDVTNTGNQNTGRGGYDYGNSAMDINSEDIASVEVLKGPAGTALYGSRAANGVLIITTKKGSKKANKGLGVTISSSILVGQINKNTMPTYQKDYGQGYGKYYGPDTVFSGEVYNGYVEEVDVDGDGVLDGLSTPMGEDASFGLAFSEADKLLTWESVHPELTETYLKPQPYEAAENDASTYYRNSLMLSNNVAIDGGNENGTFRLSLSDTQTKGIVDNSSLKKNNAALNINYNLNEKVSVSSSINYVQNSGRGRYGTGYDSRNPNQSFRQWYGVSTDMLAQKDAYESTGKNLTWNPYGFQAGEANRANPHYFDNYYWTVNENYSTDSRNRLIGNFVVNYQLTDWFNIMGRVSNDTYNEIREERIAVGSTDPASYSKYQRSFTERNYDLIGSIKKDLSSDLNLNADVGLNIRRESWNQTTAETNGGLVVPNVYSFSNSVSSMEAPSEVEAQRSVDGYFGRASLGYKRFLFLDVSGRYDISSTLPDGENAYFYPAVALSMVYSEILGISGMDFGKVRVNFAQVGSDAPVQSINPVFTLNTPVSGIALASATNTRLNANLKPEVTTGLELGFENKFANNRLGFDLTLYQSNTANQILAAKVSSSSGSYYKYINAGDIQNQGVELSLYADIVKTEDFMWTTKVNWAKNVNEVVALDGDLTTYQLASVQGGITVEAEVGQPYGVIKGTNFVLDAAGERIVYDHPSGGVRYAKSSEPEVIGNMLPDWNAGWSNTFRYKNVSASALIDMQKGGQFFSLDTWYGYGTGIYDITAGTNDKGNPVRDAVEDGGGINIGGVVAATDADGAFILDDDGNKTSDGTVNEVYGYMGSYSNALGWATAPGALHVHDATYIKLRQVSIAYTIPQSKLEKIPFTAVTVAIIGKNLAILHKNAPYTDPESGLSAGNIQGYQSGAYPTVREIGLNLTLKF